MEEYHVDGFRFDLASVMCRDELGNPIASPPVVREIAKDPVLSQACPAPLLYLARHAAAAAAAAAPDHPVR